MKVVLGDVTRRSGDSSLSREYCGVPGWRHCDSILKRRHTADARRQSSGPLFVAGPVSPAAAAGNASVATVGKRVPVCVGGFFLRSGNPDPAL